MLCHVQLFETPWTAVHQTLCPGDFPGKNTGMSCHFLLQEIFPTQGLNLSPESLTLADGFFTTDHWGSPCIHIWLTNFQQILLQECTFKFCLRQLNL